MFSIFKKRPFTVFPFEADMHSHLLPGVDDGSPDPEASIALMKGLLSLGYQRFVTTPHIYRELYPNTRDTLQPAFAALQSALETAGLEVSIRYAAEYFLDDYFDELLRDRRDILTLHDNLVLVEISFVQPPMDLDRRLFDLQMAGYKPVLAHPERYNYWHDDRAQWQGLKERGILLQLNLLSLIGYYGRSVAETARYLVKEGLVDLVGTDCHHERHVSALKKGAGNIMDILDPLIRKDKLLNNRIF